jgi:hypothetical protein
MHRPLSFGSARPALKVTAFTTLDAHQVHRGHHEHVKHSVPSDMPPTITQPICAGFRRPRRWPAPAAGAQHHGAGGHHDGAQALRRCDLHLRASSGHALFAQLVGELHDQDAVLGDQAHQRDQADLLNTR